MAMNSQIHREKYISRANIWAITRYALTPPCGRDKSIRDTLSSHAADMFCVRIFPWQQMGARAEQNTRSHQHTRKFCKKKKVLIFYKRFKKKKYSIKFYTTNLDVEIWWFEKSGIISYCYSRNISSTVTELLSLYMKILSVRDETRKCACSARRVARRFSQRHVIYSGKRTDYYDYIYTHAPSAAICRQIYIHTGIINTRRRTTLINRRR